MPTVEELRDAARAETQKRVLMAYRGVVGCPDWRLVHLDMLQWAHECKDAMVRAGIHDALSRLVRLAGNPGPIVTKEEGQ